MATPTPTPEGLPAPPPSAIPSAPIYPTRDQTAVTTPARSDTSVNKEGQDDAKANDDGSSGGSPSFLSAVRARMEDIVSHEDASIPLAWQALLTGLVDALVYARSSVWTGFQTGNMVQFSQNIAQFMLPNAERFPLLTVERIVSIFAFLLGSFLGSLGGRRFGDRLRGWQFLTAFVQSCSLWGAAAILLTRPDDEAPNFRYWPAIIALTAFSMGMQSIAAQKLVSPSFATTVAFTATLSQVASDPYLFALTLSPVEQLKNYRAQKKAEKEDIERREAGAPIPAPSKPRTLGRDRRLLSIFALCTGAGVAECLLYSRAGISGGMAIAAGFKLIQAFLWLQPRADPTKLKVKA